MLRKLTLTKEPKKRDALAVRIYQKFLYLGAKQFLHLPDYLLKQIDQTAVMCRPTSPTLKALTEFSSLYLQTTVNTFLSKGLDSGTDEVSDSLFPPLHNSKRVRRCKVCTHGGVRCVHVYVLLWVCGYSPVLYAADLYSCTTTVCGPN